MLIRVLDLETTGFPPDAEVCEIAAVTVVALPLHAPTLGLPTSQLVKPIRPMPPLASAVHHLVDEDLEDMPAWGSVWPDFLKFGDVFCAHQAEFEQAFITPEMTGGKPWICTDKCARRLWPDAPGHSNQALRYWLNPVGLQRKLANLSHRAGPDAYVTAHILCRMLEETTVEQLLAWTLEPKACIRVPFGDFKGQPWSAPDEGLLHWILNVSNFGDDVKDAAAAELKRREAALAEIAQ